MTSGLASTVHALSVIPVRQRVLVGECPPADHHQAASTQQADLQQTRPVLVGTDQAGVLVEAFLELVAGHRRKLYRHGCDHGQHDAG